MSDAPIRWTKHDAGKPKPTMLPAKALLKVAEVMEHGADKYGEDNWRKSPSVRPYVDAALRHLLHHGVAETPKPDLDSCLPALAHAAASCLIALELALEHNERGRSAIIDPDRRGPISPGDERG